MERSLTCVRLWGLWPTSNGVAVAYKSEETPPRGSEDQASLIRIEVQNGGVGVLDAAIHAKCVQPHL